MASRCHNIRTFERLAHRSISASEAAWSLSNVQLAMDPQFTCDTDLSIDACDY